MSFTANGTDFRGGFSFLSAGGELDGAFGWAAPAVAMEGIVGGPSSMPQFSLTGGVSHGVTLTDVSGGGEIEFTAVTCERLEGIGVNWDQAFPGMVTITDPVWWAVRDGAVNDPEAFFDAVDALRAEVDDIITGLIDGSVFTDVRGRIEPLLSRAEDVASALGRTDRCGSAYYRSIVADEIARLVEFAVSDGQIETVAFAQILLTGVRAGLIGSGAEARDPALEARAMDAVADRIQEAIDNGDPIALDYLALIAGDLGWYDLELEANLGIVAVGGY